MLPDWFHETKLRDEAAPLGTGNPAGGSCVGAPRSRWFCQVFPPTLSSRGSQRSCEMGLTLPILQMENLRPGASRDGPYSRARAAAIIPEPTLRWLKPF